MAVGVGAGVDVAVGGESVGGIEVAVADSGGGEEQVDANKARMIADKAIRIDFRMRSTSRIINIERKRV